MSKRPLRGLSLLLVLLTLASLWTSALADPWWRYSDKYNGVEKYVNAYTVKVYAKPSAKSKVREVVPFAKELLVLAEKKGWAKVMTVNREEGYCKAESLTAQNPNTLNQKLYSQKNGVTVYWRPSIKGGKMTSLNRNQTVTAIAATPMGEWLRVEVDGSFGYVQRPYVDTAKYKQGEPAWIVGDAVRVYFDKDNENSVATTVYFGQEVYLVSRGGEWAKIRNRADLVGYCSIDSVSTVDPNTVGRTVYTQVEGNFLFVSSSDLSGRRRVGLNAEMTLIAVDANRFWARVWYNNNYFYIPYVFLDTEKRLGDYKTVVTRAAVNIREGTKLSSAIVATVPTGTELLLIGATDNRAKVSTLPDAAGNRSIGFVELKYLR